MIPNRAAHHIIKSRLRLLYRQKESETSHFGAYYVKQLSNPLLATLVPLVPARIEQGLTG